MRRDILYHRLFDLGVALKGLDGLLEVLGGMALVFTTRPMIVGIVARLTREELSEDPHDFVATHLVSLAHHLSLGTRHFLAIYLLGHGAIKIVLSVGLLREWRWAFPSGTLVLLAFIGYQCQRLASHGVTPMLLALTLLDVAIVLLVVREWRVQERKRHRRTVRPNEDRSM